MKKIYLSIIFCCLLSISCTNDGIHKEKYIYEFFNDSELTTTYYPESYMKFGTISEGNKTVFKYTYIAADNEQIADDEYSEYIQFEIYSDLDSFILEGAALSEVKLILTKSCFCYWPYDSEKDVPPTGTISGDKIAFNRWKITLNVTFYGHEIRSFDEIFVLK